MTFISFLNLSLFCFLLSKVRGVDCEGHVVEGGEVNETWSWVSENLMSQSLHDFLLD